MHAGTRFLRVGVAMMAAFVLGCNQGGEAPPTAGDGAASAPAAKEPAGTGEVVARYGGKTLTSDQVTKELERLPAPSRTYLAAPERKKQFVENLVMNDLLFEEGKKAGYLQDADVERQVNELRKRLVVQRVMRQYQTPPTITDEQVKAWYDQNPDLYSTTQIKASHILVKDEAVAKEILAELRAHPEKFADLAKEKSIDTATGQRGGDLGLFGQGRMVPEFERAAFALQVNQISEVVKTQYGYHIIIVTERKEGERKPFDQVKEPIRATLRNKAQQEQVQNYYDTLKKQAAVEIDDAALARVALPATPPGGAGGMGDPHMGHGH
jgi:peptidyl-prolyl cis-trans isomerase C